MAFIFVKESPASLYYYHRINLEKSISRIPELVLMFRSSNYYYDYHNFFIYLTNYQYVFFKLNLLNFLFIFFKQFFLFNLKNKFFNYIFFSFIFFFKKYFQKYLYYEKKRLSLFLSDRIDPLFCVNLRIFYGYRVWDHYLNIFYFFWIYDIFPLKIYPHLNLFYNKLDILSLKRFDYNHKIYFNLVFLKGIDDFVYSSFEVKSKKSLICDRVRMPSFLNYLKVISSFPRFFVKSLLNTHEEKRKNLLAYRMKFISRFDLNEDLVKEILSKGEDYSMKKLKNEKKHASVYEYSNFTGKRLLFLEYNADALHKKSKFENVSTLNNFYKYRNYMKHINKRKVFRLKNDFFEKNPLLDPDKFIENTEEIYYLSNPAARFSIDKDDDYLELLENVTDTEVPEEYLGDIFEDTEELKKIVDSVTKDFD